MKYLVKNSTESDENYSYCTLGNDGINHYTLLENAIIDNERVKFNLRIARAIKSIFSNRVKNTSITKTSIYEILY